MKPSGLLSSRGEILLLCTDGIAETLDRAGASFGFDRVQEALVPGGASRGVHDRVLRELDRFRCEEPVYDACSLVVMTRETD